MTPDGVFALDEDGPARFVPLPPPEDEDVEAILRRVIRRTAKTLAAYDDESEDDALAALQAAEVDRRLRYPDPFPHVRRSSGQYQAAGLRAVVHLTTHGRADTVCA